VQFEELARRHQVCAVYPGVGRAFFYTAWSYTDDHVPWGAALDQPGLLDQCAFQTGGVQPAERGIDPPPSAVPKEQWSEDVGPKPVPP
jgi:hypothetical protein